MWGFNDTESVAIDRSEVMAEAYPGAANDIEKEIRDGDGLVCEQHPNLSFGHVCLKCNGSGVTIVVNPPEDCPSCDGHDTCAGPGMIVKDIIDD